VITALVVARGVARPSFIQSSRKGEQSMLPDEATGSQCGMDERTEAIAAWSWRVRPSSATDDLVLTALRLRDRPSEPTTPRSRPTRQKWSACA
jgi:hypothetical protein